MVKSKTCEFRERLPVLVVAAILITVTVLTATFAAEPRSSTVTPESLCRNGHPIICLSAAIAAADEAEFDLERELHELGCKGDVAASCMNLGAIFIHGNEITKIDPDLAAKYSQKGCKLEDPRACSNLAQLILLRGTTGSALDVTDLWEKSCGLGYRKACQRLGPRRFPSAPILKPQLKNCPSDRPVEEWTKCVGGSFFDSPNGPGIYTGEFRDGSPYGLGQLSYSLGMYYYGEVKDLTPDGQGHQWTEAGFVAAGSFVNGVSHGPGSLTENGVYQRGEWVNDEFFPASDLSQQCKQSCLTASEQRMQEHINECQYHADRANDRSAQWDYENSPDSRNPYIYGPSQERDHCFLLFDLNIPKWDAQFEYCVAQCKN